MSRCVSPQPKGLTISFLAQSQELAPEVFRTALVAGGGESPPWLVGRVCVDPYRK
jgi:hypothetical protein